jgi:biotin-dependent carboxylase-like uncharacterized protein
MSEAENKVEVVRAGPLTTFQDRGRPGLAQLGVPPSGAADLVAFQLGNRIVGNDADAAALEATLVGPTLRFAQASLVVVTGAEAGATVAGRPLARGIPAAVPAGALLELGACRDGVRAYICVRGGFAVEATLGSRSHDLLTGLGPPPLRDGDRLPVGPEPARPSQHAGNAVFQPWGEPTLSVLPGPRDDWFPPEALAALTEVTWRVGIDSNRIGIRLEGPPLARLDRGELLSEGLVTGAIQVTSAGQPIVLGPDHPTTGGYPVIAVVLAADVALAGQLAPGANVRFRLARPAPSGTAISGLAGRERA